MPQGIAPGYVGEITPNIKRLTRCAMLHHVKAENPGGPDPTLAEAIDSALAERGYGAKSALARAAGVTPTAVGRWANGQSLPETNSWSRIESFLGWPRGRVGELMKDEARATSRRILASPTATDPERLAALVIALVGQVDDLERREAEHVKRMKRIEAANSSIRSTLRELLDRTRSLAAATPLDRPTQ